MPFMPTAALLEDNAGSLPWLNVKDQPFNAVGDGAANDTTAIQAAIDACVPGGVVYFPPGTYKITTGLTTSTPNIELFGGGGIGQYGAVGTGSTVIDCSGAIVGFTFNPTAASTLFQGPIVRQLTFKGSGSGTGGILVKRSNNWIIENVSVTGFTSGYGITSDGTGNVNQYAQMVNPNVSDCLIGIDVLVTNGMRILGGLISLNSNAGSPRASSTGIRIQSGDTFTSFGTVIQEAAVGVDIQAAAVNCGLFGGRYEAFTTPAIKISGDNNYVFGYSINNSLNGSGGTGISVESGALGNMVYGGIIEAVASRFTNSGTQTFFSENAQLLVSGIIQMGDFYFQEIAPGNGLANNNLYVQSSLVTGYGGSGRVYLNGAAGPNWSTNAGTPEGAIGAPVGSICSDTTNGKFYVKATGTGNTGWVVAGTQT